MLRLIKRYKRLSFLIGLVLAALLLFISFKFLLSPAQPVSTYELPYVQNFDDVDLKRWFTNGGVWSIRSGTLVQTVGGEDPAHLHIPLKVPENQPYHISVFLTVKKDTRSIGLSFNAQYPNLISKEQRVYLNQPVQGQFELVAGYMDSTGSFVPQSQVPISANTGSYRLDVYVYESTYLVQLNGQRMIDSRSLYYKNGMVGFYAVGSATFDTLKVSAAESSNPGNMVYTSDFDQNPGGAGWVPISGSWSIDAKQMTQSDASVADAAIGYETSTFQNYVIQSTFTHQQGAGAGILFNMPSPYQLNSAHVVRYSDETDSLIWGNYDVKGAFVRQGFVNVPAPGVRSHKLAVYSGENSYDIYLDDQLVAKNIPLNEKRGSIGLITSHAAAAFSSVEVFPLFGVDTQPTAILTPVTTLTKAKTPLPLVTPSPLAKTTQFIPAATKLPANNSNIWVGPGSSSISNFSGQLKQSGWNVIRGNWAFTEGNLNQNDLTSIDASIVYTPRAYQNYSLEVGFSQIEKYGAGVLFNMPYTDRLNGAQMVRYSESRPGAIFWGYYDDTGKFIGQGYTSVAEAGTTRHVFRVFVREKDFDIYLDGKLIVRNLATQQPYGYAGLITTKSTASFDTVSIGSGGIAAATATNSLASGFNDTRVLSGKWETKDSVIQQTVTDIGDYVLSTGISASEFTLEARITLSGNEKSGGGFIFHMPDQGKRSGAYIVRLIDNGGGVFWGYFDQNNGFVGQGTTAITQAATYKLTVNVRADRMDVSVNDKVIFENVKLYRSDGWLGLIAHGGVVKFDKLKLNVTTLSDIQ